MRIHVHALIVFWVPREILKQESENGNPDATHHATFHSCVDLFNQLNS